MTETVLIPEPIIGHVTFRSYVPKYEFTARLGDGAIVPSDGFGGWDVTPRPRRRGLTEWNGNNPMTIDIPVLFDHFRAGTSVEDDVQQLERMAGWGGQGGEPPLLAFNSGGLIPHDQHDGPTHDWVISAVAWGDADRNDHGNRIRQAATITVMEYVEDDVLSDESAAQRHKARKNAQKHKGKTGKNKKVGHLPPYTVKAGDTISKIAKSQLKNANRWREIAKLNHIRDPKNIHVGQKLKMP